MAEGHDGRNGRDGIGVDLQKCGQHDKAIDALERSDSRQWDIIEKIQSRLPVWATFAFGILTLVIGWLLASAFKKII